jgi:hypothetical protein
VEDITKRRVRASMTSHAIGLQDETENNGNSGAVFFQSVLRCGESSTETVPHNLMKPVKAITRHKEMTRSPSGVAETVLFGDYFLRKHTNDSPHSLMKVVEATRDKAMTRSPSGAAETVLLGDHFLQQVSDLSCQADPLGRSVSSSESRRLYREEVHQMSLRWIVPVRTKDLTEYVRKLDYKTIHVRRVQLRQTIEHCQSKLLGVVGVNP